MAFSHGTPNSIVTDGLVFCIDAANKVSSPGSGTTCHGLINGIEGTLSTSNIFENSNNGITLILYKVYEKNFTYPNPFLGDHV